MDELRDFQLSLTLSLIKKFLINYPISLENNLKTSSKPSYLKKRRPEDSEIFLTEQQRKLACVCDNLKYPLFFKQNGKNIYLSVKK